MRRVIYIREKIMVIKPTIFPKTIASFVLEYIANLKSSVVEKLLRTIQNKQRQDGTVLAYT